MDIRERPMIVHVDQYPWFLIRKHKFLDLLQAFDAATSVSRPGFGSNCPVLDLSLLLPLFYSYLHQMLRRRIEIKRNLEKTDQLPEFPSNSECRESTWKVAPIPRRLQCRHIDLGDVSPSNTEHLIAAMNSSAQGIQVGVFLSRLLAQQNFPNS